MACPAFVFPTHDATRDGRGVRTLSTPRQWEPGVDWGSLMVPRTPGPRCHKVTHLPRFHAWSRVRRDHGGRRGPGHGRSAEALAGAVRHDPGLGHRLCVCPRVARGHWRWLGPGRGLGTDRGRGPDVMSGHRQGPCAMPVCWGPNGGRSLWRGVRTHAGRSLTRAERLEQPCPGERLASPRTRAFVLSLPWFCAWGLTPRVRRWK